MVNPEFSPAESFLTTTEDFHSLFSQDESVSPADTALTPPASIKEEDETGTSLDSEKKPVKKRKSWGQELPTPTTNLPPRKRAKTEAEKEQRRIERVLRNRAAAQSSRERKRKEVEALEDEKLDLEKENVRLSSRVNDIEMENSELNRRLCEMAAQMTALKQMITGVTGSSTSEPASLSQSVSPCPSSTAESTSKVDIPELKLEFEPNFDFSVPTPPPQSTLDPNALLSSPPSSSMDEPTALAPNMTQHPAEMLCDLQCLLGANRPHWASSTTESDRIHQEQLIFLTVLATTISQVLSQMMSCAIYSLHLPLLAIFSSLKTGSPLTYPIIRTFPLIPWLISTPLSPIMPTATSSDPNFRRMLATPRLRFRLLERLLACSPALARPLRDATGEALLLKSSEFGRSGSAACTDGLSASLSEWAVLMGIMWATEMNLGERRTSKAKRKREDSTIDTEEFLMRLEGGGLEGPKKSKWEQGSGWMSFKRLRRSPVIMSNVLSGKASR